MGIGLEDGVYLCTGYLQKLDDPNCIWASVVRADEIGKYTSIPIPYKKIDQESFIKFIRKGKSARAFYFTVQNDSINIIYTMLKY